VSGGNGTDDVAALQSEIERTREELAHTVDQLAAKLDVKSRVRNRVTTADGRPAPPVVAGVVLLGAAIVVVIAVRRRRR
jgi:hypothetical protein